ncbi:flagellar biosynthetic protein FliR [Qingshengfaniella alkalisoli]|uniref:Flagellar biosynthetic protein FliR n=1 Tax=Qingshengfaniella alkalisoli TaxID=2599296 RepID=A0A5B8IW22_9RHOB|nr:flagellar biosynthetic protein FliR [Qingshengfaniella alkalisoli]
MASQWIWVAWVVFLRVGAAIALIPVFGERLVPLRIKLGLAAAFTCIVAPAVASDIGAIPSGLSAVVWLSGAEALNGLVFGFSLRVFIWLLQIAGSVIAQSASLSQLLGGAGVDPQPAISQLLLFAGLALAAMADLHVQIAAAIIRSYHVLPPGIIPIAGDLSQWSVGRVASVFSLAFSYSSPFIIASLIYNVALGVINRAMPQLMVAFVGAPAITFGGLVLLLVLTPLLLPLWLRTFMAHMSAPIGVLP